jgi:hypothetical protein
MAQLDRYTMKCLLATFVLVACARCNAPQRVPHPSVVTTREGSEPSRSADVPADPALRYPPGRWQRAAPGVLGNVMLWPAHILVRHRASLEHDVPFSAVHWQALPPPPQRTREEALVIARQVQARAQREPAKFADFARQYSEDVTNAGDGGSLGGCNALMLAPWPLLLDVLAAIKPGEVSRVVESPYGFHIFTRLPPAPAEKVSGSHIVIAYDEAPWLYELQGRDNARRRSRQEAVTLADQVYKEASEDPSRFADLVQRYSDHQDASSDGDFGSWSTHEATPYHREIDVLRALHVNGVSEPKDTFLGVQVILRTLERERAIFSADLIKIPRGTPDGQAQQAADSASGTAARILNDLATRPSEFSKIQNQYCCIGSMVWQEGREEAVLTRSVAKLAIGEMSREVIATRTGFVIAKRSAVPPAFDAGPPAFELPSPDVPDTAGL